MASDIPESAFAAAAQAYFDAGPVVPEVTVGALTRSPRLRAAVESAYRAGLMAVHLANGDWANLIGYKIGDKLYHPSDVVIVRRLNEDAQRSGVAAQNLTEELS